MDNRVPIRRLEMFCLVVDEGGVTRAAENLRLAQPAVTAQLRSLERSLGAALFSRRGSSLSLTEAGDRVYAWAKEVVAGSLQVQRDVDDLASGAAGTLEIGSSMAIGTYLLPPLMTRLRTDRPGADITVRISEPAEAWRMAQIGEVDFAVTSWLDEPAPESLTVEKLWEEPLVLCTGPNGPPDGDAIDVAQIADLPVIGTPRGIAFDRMLETQLRAHGVTDLPVVIRLGHREAMKQAAVANGWVFLGTLYSVAQDVAEGRLRVVRIRDARLSESIGLYHRTAKYFSPLQRKALDVLRETGHHQSSY